MLGSSSFGFLISLLVQLYSLFWFRTMNFGLGFFWVNDSICVKVPLCKIIFHDNDNALLLKNSKDLRAHPGFVISF